MDLTRLDYCCLSAPLPKQPVDLSVVARYGWQDVSRFRPTWALEHQLVACLYQLGHLLPDLITVILHYANLGLRINGLVPRRQHYRLVLMESVCRSHGLTTTLAWPSWWYDHQRIERFSFGLVSPEMVRQRGLTSVRPQNIDWVRTYTRAARAALARDMATVWGIQMESIAQCLSPPYSP